MHRLATSGPDCRTWCSAVEPWKAKAKAVSSSRSLSASVASHAAPVGGGGSSMASAARFFTSSPGVFQILPDNVAASLGKRVEDAAHGGFSSAKMEEAARPPSGWSARGSPEEVGPAGGSGARLLTSGKPAT